MEQEKITKIRYKKECTECGMMIKGNSPQTVNYNLKAHSMQKHNKQEEDKNEEDDKQNQE
jgi:predicted small metal-binding protein